MMKQKKKIRRSKEPCYFCVNEIEPDYKDIDRLEKYVSSKGRIVSRWETGLCQKHQKRLAVEIKRSRHLGLLPFVMRVD